MTARYDAIVIGAGHNGLVTAAYLSRQGLRTLVLERRDVVGGAAVTETFYPGFRVDSGAHRLGALHPTVVADLDLAAHGCEIMRADPSVLTPLPDGRHLSLWRGPEKTVESLQAFSSADARQWTPFCRRLAMIAGFLRDVYATTPAAVPELRGRDLWTLFTLGRRLRLLGKQDMFEVLRTLPMSVAEFLDEWFESDVVKGTLGAAGIAGMFQGPMAAGTAWVMLHHHVQCPAGVVRPTDLVRGGVGNLTGALAAAAKRQGAEIRTGAAVARILVEDGRASGVLLESGHEIPAGRVVSNADPRRTFINLITPAHLDPGFLEDVGNIKFRGATAKVHLALDTLPDFRGLRFNGGHLQSAISISPSLTYLERAYDDAKYGRVSSRPYLEIRIPSLMDSSLAPPGKHVMSMYVQYAPYTLRETAWDDRRRDELGKTVIDTIAEYAPSIESAIIHRQVLTPPDLEATFGLTEGNIYHGELTMDQLFFMRPTPGWARYRSPIAGLYLCGAGTHPGGGLNGASGFNAAREILRDVKKGNARE